MAPHRNQDGTSANNCRIDRTITPEPSVPLLAGQAKALISCNQKLQDLGIDNTIKLPQLCVIGDQSTGKSSLIEALSTIQVPKAKGCCTQCPIAINLSSGANESAPWVCTISIEEHYDYHHQLLPRGVTKNNPFGPWQKKDMTKTVLVKTTHDKDEVPDLIRAAQAAILNPGSRPADYLGSGYFKALASQKTKFSPNVIKLDISEGKWPNLSFIDLPGVIANTGRDQDKYLVKLIKNLVHRYAAADRSINMLTLPMTHDIENSQACAIIQELKAEPHTLAVFTKADLADEDQKAQFLKRAKGDDDLEFRHGYHFVIMPDDTQYDQARLIEATAFEQAPWCQLDRNLQSRLGVENLREYLNNLLSEKIAETLPDNLQCIETRLAQIDCELGNLPEPPNAALLPMQLQQSVTQFEGALKSTFLGDTHGMEASAKIVWAQNTVKFRDTIIKAKPTVFLSSKAEKDRLAELRAKANESQSRMANSTNPMEISSDEEVDRPIPVKDETTKTSKFDPVHRFRLEDIREINQQYYQACVPGEIELRAVEAMNRLSVQHWNKLLTDFMHANSALLNKQVSEVVKVVFQQQNHLEVFDVINDFVKTYLDKIMHQEWTTAEEVCRLERQRPFTYDSASIKMHEAKCLEERLRKRVETRLDLAKAEAEAVQGGSRQRRRLDESDLEPDPYKTELLMSAKTRAYYEVASTRFVDNICMGIFGRLLPACTNDLIEDLKQHLGLYDHTRHGQIITWMSENPEREEKRARLLHEKKQLHEGLQYIRDVLGTNKPSPLKRHKSGSPEDAHAPETPSKRKKTSHTNRIEATNGSTPSRLAKRVGSIELHD